MTERKPFTQRMDPHLYERVEERASVLGRPKASIFDEMMRDWLAGEDTDGLRKDVRDVKRYQAAILERLSPDDDSAVRIDCPHNEEQRPEDNTPGRESTADGESVPLNSGAPGRVVDSLADYRSSLPPEYTLSKAALRAVPERIDDDDFDIDPDHLDIDEYPKPVRVKRCLPVAVLRYEFDGPFTGVDVRDTIQRVLGTERYANRYYTNVTRHLHELPGGDEEQFAATASAYRAAFDRLAEEPSGSESGPPRD